MQCQTLVLTHSHLNQNYTACNSVRLISFSIRTEKTIFQFKTSVPHSKFSSNIGASPRASVFRVPFNSNPSFPWSHEFCLSWNASILLWPSSNLQTNNFGKCSSALLSTNEVFNENLPGKRVHAFLCSDNDCF